MEEEETDHQAMRISPCSARVTRLLIMAVSTLKARRANTA